MKPTIPDAIEQLDADHLVIHGLFQSYRNLVRGGGTPLQRRALAEEICLELAIHARLEEELFYPAVREALQDDDLVDEAEDQHGGMRDVLAQVLATAPEDTLYDARVAVLADYVERHVRQEREQVFNRVLASGLDVHALGRSIHVRKTELRTVADALREDAIASAAAA